MAPPCRRQHCASTPPLFLLATIFLSILLPCAHAQSAVLGLDIGTEYIKAALVKPGIPLDIVLTKDSKRKEAAAIAFKPNTQSQDASQLPERLYGGDALAVAARFPGDVYPNLKPLLGSILDTQAAVQTYRQRYPGLALEQDKSDSGKPGFRSKGEQEPFTVEELLAMEMVSIKHNAEAMAGSGFAVRNAVITVPAFYTVDERRAIQLAAELGGLNVMSLMSDGLAVALNYATSRNFPNIDKGDQAEHHLVYDMGAGSTTATVLKFQARNVRDVGKFNKTIQEVNVVGTGWDRTLGGDALNELIVDDMITKFVDTKAAKASNVQAAAVKGHGRTTAKLWKEAERLRQVLSANTATTANFESLYEDIDFKYKLSRAEFETLAAPYAARVSKPLIEALAAAKLSTAELNSIVLHGGMVRTPIVQKELETQVGDPAKLRSNVNADEAAVFGAAFKAAGLSPSFRVKDIKSNDAATYAASIAWDTKTKTRQQQIFVPTSQAGTTKQLSFNMDEDFVLTIAQQVIDSGSSIEAAERGVAEVKVANLTVSIVELEKFGCSRSEIKIVLSLRLDPVLDIPEVSAGSTSCEFDPETKKGGVVDDVKGFFGFGGKKEQEPLVYDNSPASDSSETPSPSSASSSSSSASSSISSSSASSSGSSSSASPQSSSKAKSKPQAKPAKKTKTIPLLLQTTRRDSVQYSTSKITAMEERLLAFDKSDASRRAREEAFNALEASVYRARDMLTDGPFVAVSSEAQRSEISALISKLSDWLHGDGSSATIDTIKEQRTSLKALVDPILRRKGEVADRPEAIEALEKALNQTGEMVQTIRESIDKAAAESAAKAAKAATEPVGSVADAATDSAESAASAVTDVVGDAAASASSIIAGEDAGEAETPATEATPINLDDSASPSSSQSTSTSTSSSPSSTPTPDLPKLPTYTESDYTSLSSIYTSTKSWLTNQLSSQNALSPSEEPVLTNADIRAKTKEIEEATQNLVLRTFDFSSMPGFEKLRDLPGFEGMFGQDKKSGEAKSAKAGKSGKKTKSSRKAKTKSSKKNNTSVRSSDAAKASETPVATPVPSGTQEPEPAMPVVEPHGEL